MTPDRKHRRTGFTLIEVTLALAIFALTATLLTEAFVNALRQWERRQPRILLEQDLAYVRQQIQALPDRETLEAGGTIRTPALGDVDWEAELAPTRLLDLLTVTLTTRWDQPEAEALPPGRQTETLLMLRPGWMEADDRERLLEDKRRELEDGRWGLEWAQP
jgi:prepilin-type N-terminal cleavage/methylation domain-containing protein